MLIQCPGTLSKTVCRVLGPRSGGPGLFPSTHRTLQPPARPGSRPDIQPGPQDRPPRSLQSPAGRKAPGRFPSAHQRYQPSARPGSRFDVRSGLQVRPPGSLQGPAGSKAPGCFPSSRQKVPAPDPARKQAWHPALACMFTLPEASGVPQAARRSQEDFNSQLRPANLLTSEELPGSGLMTGRASIISRNSFIGILQTRNSYV